MFDQTQGFSESTKTKHMLGKQRGKFKLSKTSLLRCDGVLIL